MGYLAFSLFVCSPSPFVCLFSCSLFLAFCPLPKLQRSQFRFVSSYLPPCVVLYTHPSISHSFVSFICHPVSLCLSRDSPSAEWWKVGCPFSRGVAKHIKAVRLHIWQSQMMIRVPGLSKGTEWSFVMQGIPPYLCLHLASNPSSDKGLTL